MYVYILYIYHYVQNELKVYFVKYKEYSQYFTITISEIQPVKTVGHYVVHL